MALAVGREVVYGPTMVAEGDAFIDCIILCEQFLVVVAGISCFPEKVIDFTHNDGGEPDA